MNRIKVRMNYAHFKKALSQNLAILTPYGLVLFFVFLSARDIINFTPQPLITPPPPLSIPTLNQLERIKKRGYFVVLSRKDQTTYYKTADGFSGLEYDLVQLFAKHLGVEAYFIFPDKFSSLLQKIQAGEADFAAAGLTITPKRQQHLRFTPPYQKITEQIIYRSGTPRPKKINDLLNKTSFEVTRDTSHIETLKNLQKKYPQLQWTENKNLDTHNLLHLLNEKLIDYTIADSNQINLLKRVYPKLNVAFNISPALPLAWAFKQSTDDSLYNAAVSFFKTLKQEKTLAQLIERHYAHTYHLKYVGYTTFRRHFIKRLPKYRKFFQQYAKKRKLNWQLLAALSYQESHWNPNAVSPTGVKGLMMLTRSTAKQMGVKDRLSPPDTIRGGTNYLKKCLKKIPRRITEPDRTWFALASYNIGFGHLEDARILAQQQGDNPDRWIDVKKYLPLLAQEKWHTQTKRGYARGSEAINYVANIRTYLDLLIWYENNKHPRLDNKSQHI